MIKKNELTTRKITTVGILGGISIILGMTPLGFIPLGPIKLTTMHMPVIIGAIIEGPIVGGLIGLVFGLFSMFQAVVKPTPLSFVFLNPIVSVLPRVLIGIVSYYIYEAVNKISSDKSNKALNIVLGCIITYLTISSYKIFDETQNMWFLVINLILIICTIVLDSYIRDKYKSKATNVAIATVAGTLTNTIGVLAGIYFFHGEKFITELGKDPKVARRIIFSIGVTNGIPEIIVGILVVVSVIAAMENRLN